MGARRSTFGKLQHERAKKAKAAAKRARRQERLAEATTDDTTPAPEQADDSGLGELSASELLRLVEMTHQRFESGAISYEEFEAQKAELFARLPID